MDGEVAGGQRQTHGIQAFLIGSYVAGGSEILTEGRSSIF